MSCADPPEPQPKPVCGQCGAELPPQGPCLRCLLGLGLDELSATPLEGLQTARYTILRPLGRGGMGEVFLALDTTLDRKVALKFLSEELLQHPGAEGQLLDEARSAAALDHPFVCKVYETGSLEGNAFIAMEYVEGQTLRQVMDQGRLALDQALRIADAVADALESAHRHGIIHRDLKPSNVMLTSQGHVKVMDFGIARRLEALEEKGDGALPDWTRETSVQGTVLYMSPQQARGEPVDARSDIFSLGVMLYEMIAGIHPFHRDTPEETWQALIDADCLPLSRQTPGRLPESIEKTVRRMLAPDPEERFQSAEEVRQSLKTAEERLSGGSLLRSPLRVVALLVLLAALIIAAAYWGGWRKGTPIPSDTIHRSENPQAQQAYLEGFRKLAQRTPSGLGEAARQFRNAARLDPSFAAAWAGLAEAQLLSASYGMSAPGEVIPEARRAAQQALDLDPRLAKAYTALAYIHFSYDWDWKAAEKGFQQARRLSPHDPDNLRWYGYFKAAQGQFDEALELIQQARDEAPLSWLAIVSLGRCHYVRREYDQAVEAYQRALDLQPNFRPSHLGLGLVYLKQGRLDSAIESFRKGLEGTGAAFLAESFRNTPASVEADLQELEAQSGQAYLSPYFVAVYFMVLGDRERVFEWLEKAYQEHSEHLAALKVDPIFDGIRSDQRYLDLVGRVFPE